MLKLPTRHRKSYHDFTYFDRKSSSIMKNQLTSFVFLLFCIGVFGQRQIIVQPVSGEPTLYTNLDNAIQNAPEGAVLYLSGGLFQNSHGIAIRKKLHIIGVGSYPNFSNATGTTIIDGISPGGGVGVSFHKG